MLLINGLHFLQDGESTTVSYEYIQTFQPKGSAQGIDIVSVVMGNYISKLRLIIILLVPQKVADTTAIIGVREDGLRMQEVV